ncbi:NAD(P)-dependent dehydrogenase (short-subunit alcohol dehydrogenase family) [Paraburkholderia sp. BL6669N2]|uniref:SDR family oxidoreductase n=1 Tax=Paraburkholderia sp. BL6669N2 TaxID=1938807 RepID=UPI000E394D81|nr:SDR family oxidoreductase [Paraburkholderia sp. BL6669N2]REG50956.1 NAD(P)-dependent dehydrogenase (short-subunit alcohol dehydrogenase family) [Paraburkholderia sp. BL6669N2]
MDRSSTPNVALVMGAGDSLGAALARKFAREGMQVCVARRNAEQLDPLVQQIRALGGTVHAFACDARKEEQVVSLFERIEKDIGSVGIAVFNIGANIQFNIRETTAQKYYKVWEMACFAGFLTGREAARHMAPRGQGTIFFTGATASIRGAEGYAAFAGAKHGLRSLAQSMAREFGKQGLHIVHPVIDGPIDTPFVRERFPDLVAQRPADGLLAPEDIADTYWFLHTQKRSAWTFELDIRPWLEPISNF